MKNTVTKYKYKAVKYTVYVETTIEREVSVLATDAEEAKQLAINRMDKNKSVIRKYKIIEHEAVDVEPEKNPSVSNDTL